MGSCDFLYWLWAQVLSKKVVRFKQGAKSSGMELSNAKWEYRVQNLCGTLSIAAAAT